jgi:CheY-like chemotaxis protein
LTKPIRPSELLDVILIALSAVPKNKIAPELVTRHSIRESRRHLRVLLAEDNTVNQMLAVRLLQRRGHTVTVAGNGKEALAALEKQPFDIILMDVQMPEMDGLQTTAAIRASETETGKHIPIIAITAHAMLGDKERCLDAGMDAYVSKPLQVEDLFDAIQKLCPASTDDLARVSSAGNLNPV